MPTAKSSTSSTTVASISALRRNHRCSPHQIWSTTTTTDSSIESTDRRDGLAISSITYASRAHLGRLWKVWVDSVLQAEYTYDGNGNRLNDGANYDDQDRLTDNAQYNFTYTANGELKSKTDKTTQAETLYTHDGFGSLTGVTLPDGRSIQYLMDARGRRVGKKVDGTLEWGLLYRSALQPVAEVDAAGAVITRFVYARSRNIPDYAERGDTRYAIITDHLGSLRLVVDTSSGEVVQRMEYDAWGRVIVDEHDRIRSASVWVCWRDLRPGHWVGSVWGEGL